MNQKTLKVLEFDTVADRLSQYAVSDKGKEILKQLKPKTEKQHIQHLLNETDEAVRMLLGNGTPPLEGFFDIQPIIRRAQIKALLNLRELLQISVTLRVVRQIKSYAKEVKDIENYGILNEIFETLDSLISLENEISRCVISEDEIADGASEVLFSLRKQIKRKNENIRDRLNNMISSPGIQKYLQEALITIRQGRFVLPVKQEYRQNVPGIIHDQSSSGATLFIEPIAIVELNNDLKKLKLQEDEEIERILISFTEDVHLYCDILKTNLDTLIKLDVIFAKGHYSLHINGKIPVISHGGINVKKARHPLIDPKKVVASDIIIGEEFDTLVITGPNTGGKTVTLKTAGLMCLMMQSGLFIPANDGSTLGIYKNIAADIGDEQSIEQSLSTFSSHMSNIVEITKNLQEDTLVLLDELGAGTDPTEGAALAMAILDYFRSNKIHCIVTTHYSELKQYALTQDKVENASVEFNVETLSPTYRLRIGLPGKSNAFEISNKLGLNSDIIENSKKYLSQENIRFEDVLHDIEKRRIETETNFRESHKKQEEIAKLLSQLELEKKQLDSIKQEIIEDSQVKALEIIESANEEAQSIIKEMQRIKTEAKTNAVKELESHKRNLKEQEKKYKSSSHKNIDDNIKQKPFKPGDSVLILSLNQKGYILEKPHDKTALVQVGILKTKISLKDLRHIEEQMNKETHSYSRKSINEKSRSVTNKIDVRGQTSEEMIMDVEKFIDDAYLANLHEVTIVHGKGTGVLRESLKKMLKKNPHVSDFRIGEFNEGGTGATIVTIK